MDSDVLLLLAGAVVTMIYATQVMHSAIAGKFAQQNVLARLAYVSPVLAACLGAPFLVPRSMAMTRGLLLWLVTWVASFKLLSATLGRGPLVNEPEPFRFLIKFLLPILPYEPGTRHEQETAFKSALKFLAAFSATSLMQPLFYAFAVSEVWHPPFFFRLVVECVFLWMVEEMALNLLSFVAITVFRMRVRPGMHCPLFSTSLQEFWSQRWNLPVSNILRDVCYNAFVPPRSRAAKQPNEKDQAARNDDSLCKPTPLVDSQLHVHTRLRTKRAAEAAAAADTAAASSSRAAQNVSQNAASPQGSGHRAVFGGVSERQLRAFAGTCAAFFVSGFVHEMILVIVGGSSSRGLKMFGYFAIQPILIVLQLAAFASAPWKAFDRCLPVLSHVTKVASTLMLILLSVWYLFRPPMYEAGHGLVFLCLEEHRVITEWLVPGWILSWPVGLLW